ncbi:hypothetical protein [Rubrobacter marinus]|uniref:hypothetical protein n=1 Tax=Rubrobacter marinus TaxID=2653852 RepID=UPI001A9CBAD4|nr:hypothetical protein [Rubrobacter marinus]
MTRPRPLGGATSVAFVAYEMVVDTRARGGSAPPRRIRPRRYGPVQTALVAVGWVLFLWAWVSVVRHTAPVTMLSTLGFLGACALVNEAIALGWIHHNLRIFARRGPRKAVFVPEHAFSKDFLQRELVADWTSLRGEGAILVGFDDARKTFIPYRGDPTAENLVGRAGLEIPEEDDVA